jgi:hypothetical protein
MFSVYLAGASAEHWRAEIVAEMLERSGIISLPDRWWETAAEWTGRDHEWSREESKRIALEHVRHMRECQLVWLLFPEKPSLGALFEFGHAFLRRPVLVTGPGAMRTVYTALADFVADDDRTGASEVFRLAREYANDPRAVVP